MAELDRCADSSRLLSAGGSPYAVVAILDTIKTLKVDVSTIAFGQSASTATLLLVRLAGAALLHMHQAKALAERFSIRHRFINCF